MLQDKAAATRGNVYIVDDETIIRQALGLLLREAGYHCRPFANGHDFIDALGYLAPGCILLDINMPDLDGFSVQDTLLRLRPDMPVIFMTAAGSVTTAVRAIKKGAVDFLEKPFSDSQLLAFVEDAQSHLQTMVETTGRKADAARRIAQLSPRENDVLRALLGDGTNKSVARSLALSTRTVEMHRANIMRKLAMSNFAAVVQIAIEAGLTPQPGLGEPKLHPSVQSGYRRGVEVPMRGPVKP
jgi:two-component system response regulator FixJ